MNYTLLLPTDGDYAELHELISDDFKQEFLDNMDLRDYAFEEFVRDRSDIKFDGHVLDWDFQFVSDSLGYEIMEEYYLDYFEENFAYDFEWELRNFFETQISPDNLTFEFNDFIVNFEMAKTVVFKVNGYDLSKATDNYISKFCEIMVENARLASETNSEYEIAFTLNGTKFEIEIK